MNAEQKYKKWGWAAIAGLVLVIIIACAVVGVHHAEPQPEERPNLAGQTESNPEGGDGENEGEVSGETAETEGEGAETGGESGEGGETLPAVRESGELPSTGAEDLMGATLVLALAGALVTFAVESYLYRKERALAEAVVEATEATEGTEPTEATEAAE